MPSEPRHCLDCDAPLVNPHAQRCKRCAARARTRYAPPPIASRFDAERGRAAALAKHAADKQNREDARRWREEHPDG